MSDYLTLREAAKLLRVHHRTLARWCDGRGGFPCVVIGRGKHKTRRFCRQTIETMSRENYR